MGRFGQHLLSIVAAALLVSISNILIEPKGAIGSVIKLLSGIVLAMLIVSPWTDIRFEDVIDSYSYIESESAVVAQEGKQAAQCEVAAYIKAQTEAYILDKAFAFGLDISVDVTLTKDVPPAVESVYVYGTAAPYVKKRLSTQICEDLGITEECLTWSQSIG